jgi:hypothetical protein
MERAATAAAVGQAALAARCVTDPSTLARVAAALHGQLGGTLPLLVRAACGRGPPALEEPR